MLQNSVVAMMVKCALLQPGQPSLQVDLQQYGRDAKAAKRADGPYVAFMTASKSLGGMLASVVGSAL